MTDAGRTHRPDAEEDRDDHQPGRHAGSEPDSDAFAERAAAIEAEVGRVIVGQHDLVRQTLTCLLANGHALLEGVPGLGKTMLVRTSPT